MKSYIQDLCGDEDTVVIDCAILQCRMQDVIFEILLKQVGKPLTEWTQNEIIRYVSCTHTLED
jgi:hypothetical protein